MSETTSAKWYQRIQFKVALLLFTLVTLIMGGFGIYGATTTHSTLDTELNQLLEKVGGRASKALALSVWEFNQNQGVDAIAAEMADPRVESIVLRTTDGDVFAARGRDANGDIVEPEQGVLEAMEAEAVELDSGASKHSRGLRLLKLDVEYQDESIGSLLVEVNEEAMHAAVRSYYIERIWQTLLLTIMTVVVMLIALQYLLIAPVRNLIGSAEKLSHGDLDISFQTASNDEIGQLARALDVFRQNAVEKERLQQQREVEQQEKTAQESKSRELAEEHRATQEHLRVEQQEAALRELESSRELQSRVDELLTTVDAVASGELQTPVTVKGDDAIGRIGERLDQVFRQFAISIKNISNHANTLSSGSESLTKVSASIASSAQINSERALEVSEASDEISSGVDNVAAAITEMSATVKEIASNADQATAVAKEASVLTTDARDLVSKLSDSSADIGTVIKVITSIAEQTNLLALNATIEAARAGDAGKGFAVVANEVKELAKETATATDDIAQRIQTIQHDSVSVTDSIAGISTIIDRINELQSIIAVSVDEQASASSEISRIVAHTADGSQRIAGSMTDIADAASQALSGANTAQEASGEMGGMAEELRKLVEQFRVA